MRTIQCVKKETVVANHESAFTKQWYIISFCFNVTCITNWVIENDIKTKHFRRIAFHDKDFREYKTSEISSIMVKKYDINNCKNSEDAECHSDF